MISLSLSLSLSLDMLILFCTKEIYGRWNYQPVILHIVFPHMETLKVHVLHPCVSLHPWCIEPLFPLPSEHQNINTIVESKTKREHVNEPADSRRWPT